MMEEIHSIFAAGAGAVSKMYKAPENGKKAVITRLFNQKYPYEYLSEDRSTEMSESFKAFYKENFDF